MSRTVEDVQRAVDAVLVSPPGKRGKQYEGCSCGSITFINPHLVDQNTGRVYNRCKECSALVRSAYRSAQVGGKQIFTRD